MNDILSLPPRVVRMLAGGAESVLFVAGVVVLHPVERAWTARERRDCRAPTAHG